jgi:hypothetical protein
MGKMDELEDKPEEILKYDSIERWRDGWILWDMGI